MRRFGRPALGQVIWPGASILVQPSQPVQTQPTPIWGPSAQTNPTISWVRLMLMYGESLATVQPGILAAFTVPLTQGAPESDEEAAASIINFAASLGIPNSGSSSVQIPNPPAWMCSTGTLTALSGPFKEFQVPLVCAGASYYGRSVLILVTKYGYRAFPKVQRVWSSVFENFAVVIPTSFSEIATDVIRMRAQYRVVTGAQASITPITAPEGPFYAPPSWAINAGWGTEFGILDGSIPAEDWNTILPRHAIMRQIFEQEIPFFKIGDKNYVFRCAQGFPFVMARNNVTPLAAADWRLYSPTWSDYFPREKSQIHADLAMAFGANMQGLLGCVEHKIKKRTREIERSIRLSKFVGAVAKLLLAGSIGIAVGGMFQSVGDIFALAYPDYAQWITVASKVIATVIGQVPGGGAGFAMTSILDKVGSGALTKAVEELTKTISSFGPKSAESLMSAALGLNEIEAVSAPFMLWIVTASHFGPLLAMAAKTLGYDVDLRKDVIDPLIVKANEAGLSIPEYLQQVAAQNAEEAEVGNAVVEGTVDLAEADSASLPQSDFGTIAAVGGGSLLLAWASGIL